MKSCTCSTNPAVVIVEVLNQIVMDVISHMIRAVIQHGLMAQRISDPCVVICQTCARVVVMAQKCRVSGRRVVQVMVLQTAVLQSLVVRSQCLGPVMLQKLRPLMR